jgi:hypothetical protein
MRTCYLIVAVVLASVVLVGGQAPTKPPVESVTVTGTRSREVVQGFVQSFAAPTRLIGKIARWEDGICPITVGIPAGFAKFVTQRVKDVAAKVGAPVDGSNSCEHNIAIVFTAKPQGLRTISAKVSRGSWAIPITAPRPKNWRRSPIPFRLGT